MDVDQGVSCFTLANSLCGKAVLGTVGGVSGRFRGIPVLYPLGASSQHLLQLRQLKMSPDIA